MNRLKTRYLLRFCRHALLFVAWTAVACSPVSLDGPRPAEKEDGVFNADGTLGLTVRIEIPNMVSAATKSLDEVPAYNDLNLYLLVFEQGEGLRQFAPLTLTPNQEDTEHGHEELMSFEASLEPTEKNAVIHLVATNQDLSGKIRYGTEDLVLASLYTDQGHEAYWQRIALDCNIPSKDHISSTKEDGSKNELYDPKATEKITKVKSALIHVPMIRNFCRVSVSNSANNFTLTGLYVLNTVDRGSVAPYVAGNPEGKFVDYYDKKPDGKYAGKTYGQISEQGHIGTLPTGVKLINTDPADAGFTTKSEDPSGQGNVGPVYFYERPAREDVSERTFVLLRGDVTIDGTTQQDRFYKLDLGYIDNTVPHEGDLSNDGGPVGVFAYYNLLRNFDYHIILSEVSDAGYDSYENAASGAVYNNFSAAVEARNMKSISDGQDMIFVNHTSFVFTYPDQIDTLLAQYRTGISDGKGGTEHNDLLYYMVDKSGDDVIKDVDYSGYDHGPDVKKWNTYLVKGNAPTDLLRQQRMYVYRGNRAAAGQPADYGLYRIITYFSHKPWTFEHIDTFPGLWEQMDDMPSWEWSESVREIGESKGSPLTLFFELPSGLPQALFPMDFVIEADRQNIQNAYVGNAVVRSVPPSESLFADNPTLGRPPKAPTTPRIQYVKTVTWEDYFGGLSEELIGRGSAVVRCRFLTITDLNEDNVGDSDGTSKTTIRVSNPYFNQKDGDKIVYHEDWFQRDKNTSDPTPGLWNFSLQSWSAVVDALKSGNEAAYSETTDNLTVSAPTRNTLQSGTYVREEIPDEGDPVTTSYTYLQTASSGVTFSHTRAYPGTDKRKIQVRVMSTDVAGATVVPTVTLTVNNSETTLPLKRLDDDTSTKPFPMIVFETENEIDMSKYNSVTLTVSAPSNTPVRFYRIEFYPRGEDFNAPDNSGSAG